MATTPASISSAARGIAKTLSGYVLQNVTDNETDISEKQYDQMGAVADDQSYDKKYDLSFTCYSASSSATKPLNAGDFFTYGTRKYKCLSCSEAGTYNTVVKWSVTAESYTNWPGASQTGTVSITEPSQS